VKTFREPPHEEPRSWPERECIHVHRDEVGRMSWRSASFDCDCPKCATCGGPAHLHDRFGPKSAAFYGHTHLCYCKGDGGMGFKSCGCREWKAPP
jgi:hypothetical protein